jgi:hypothetical protein
METKELKKTISLTDVANVIDTLNLEVVQNCLHLREWEATEGKIEPMYEPSLEKARKNLELNSSKWNEEELKMKFISVVMNVSEVESSKLAVFYERPLEGTLQDYEFSIICDCMIGTSTAGGRPKAPYFFLQEFKKSKGDRIDAEAQALVAMLLAQKENNDNKVLYGAWLIGENWHFTTLYGREYCVSRQYVATNPDDLRKIIYLLQFFKKFGS